MCGYILRGVVISGYLVIELVRDVIEYFLFQNKIEKVRGDFYMM